MIKTPCIEKNIMDESNEKTLSLKLNGNSENRTMSWPSVPLWDKTPFTELTHCTRVNHKRSLALEQKQIPLMHILTFVCSKHSKFSEFIFLCVHFHLKYNGTLKNNNVTILSVIIPGNRWTFSWKEKLHATKSTRTNWIQGKH